MGRRAQNKRSGGFYMRVFDGNREKQGIAEVVFGRTAPRSFTRFVFSRFGNHKQHVIFRYFASYETSRRTN